MKGFLIFENESSRFDYDGLLINFIDQAIKEDVGEGDLTTEAVVQHSRVATANFLVKQDCIIAGIELATFIFNRIDATLVFTPFHIDGDFIKAGTVLGTVSGDIHSLLKAERLVLNAMQRMSSIASKTKKIVDQATPFGVTILDTRKTTPNFRICEKWAVAIGGGKNHRFALYDQILIKDNHIKFVGGIQQALGNVLNYLKEKQLSVPIVVEVQNEEEFANAIQYPAITRILMDNFNPGQITQLIAKYDFTQKLEASGGIHAENIDAYLKSGIHYLSIGDLTHHIQSIDISLKIQ
jgi:nicotinate-nucleotide pyrophosphorylase (carboxylating)